MDRIHEQHTSQQQQQPQQQQQQACGGGGGKGFGGGGGGLIPASMSLGGGAVLGGLANNKWVQNVTRSVSHGVQELTSRKYTIPDKNVASQLLMYRQLLHTKCRPGLKLSREYQGTPAQVAVKHMPWWAEGCEQTRKMVISYDNLIRRLWLHGAIYPHTTDQDHVDTLLNDEGNPPIPHEYWVSRLGFQQTDPVTDFRSGGVLSLAMMVHVAESCPGLFQRFVRPRGDASVLPFGITSINITDMMSKFLMLAKTVDRMDALLSQKPFWRMFADPNALTACQELSLDVLADVVVELSAERALEGKAVTVFDFSHILEITETRVQYDLLGAGPKSVKELYLIHAKCKHKYQAQVAQLQQQLQQHQEPPSPSSGNENQQSSQSTTQQQQNQPQPTTGTTVGNTERSGDGGGGGDPQNDDKLAAVRDQVWTRASGLASNAGNVAGSVFSKLKETTTTVAAGVGSVAAATTASVGAGATRSSSSGNMFGATPPDGIGNDAVAGTTASESQTETIEFTPANDDSGPVETRATEPDDILNAPIAAVPATAAAATTAPPPPPPTTTTVSGHTNNHSTNSDEDWVGVGGTDIQPATDAVRNFSIGDDDDDL